METFVAKFFDERELHIAVYLTRQKLWRFFKCESKLSSLLNYFGQNFCHLLENHLTAREHLRAEVARPGVSICDTITSDNHCIHWTHMPTVHHKWISLPTTHRSCVWCSDLSGFPRNDMFHSSFPSWAPAVTHGQNHSHRHNHIQSN